MSIQSEADLIGFKRAGELARRILGRLKAMARPGVTTLELDLEAAHLLEAAGARSAPLALYGFPGHVCISLNDEAVHGIPGPRRVAAGDLVKIDATVLLDGYIADAAITVAVPPARSAGPSRAYALT